MARSTKADVIIPDIFNETVQGVFAQKNVLMGSPLAAAGVVAIKGDFGGGQADIGNIVRVPYFGVIGDFEDLVDGNPLTPRKLAQSDEQSAVTHSGLAFEATRWARSSVGRDIYEEGAEQIRASVQRKMDKQILAAATAAGGLVKDVFSLTQPRTLDYDLIVDAKMMWGDEQEDIAALAVHSKVYGDLLRLRDAIGHPLLTTPIDGSVSRFMGMPITIADSSPIDGSTMAAVVATGTSPPTVTLSGTPNAAHKLWIQIQAGGTLGVATFKFSTDGGTNWSGTMTTGASVLLTDATNDSLIGVNGASGITAAFAAGTYNADNLYKADAQAKFTTILFKKGSMAYWYNAAALQLQTDRDILVDSDIASMHLYAVPHRYRRLRGGTKPGIIRLRHNATL